MTTSNTVVKNLMYLIPSEAGLTKQHSLQIPLYAMSTIGLRILPCHVSHRHLSLADQDCQPTVANISSEVGCSPLAANVQSCFTVKGSLETGHRVEAICNIIDQVTKTPYINSLKREVGNFDEHKNQSKTKIKRGWWN